MKVYLKLCSRTHVVVAASAWLICCLPCLPLRYCVDSGRYLLSLVCRHWWNVLKVSQKRTWGFVCLAIATYCSAFCYDTNHVLQACFYIQTTPAFFRALYFEIRRMFLLTFGQPLAFKAEICDISSMFSTHHSHGYLQNDYMHLVTVHLKMQRHTMRKLLSMDGIGHCMCRSDMTVIVNCG